MAEKPLSQAVVLVVEDNADNLIITQELLRRAGVRYVNGRASGRQLFKLLESRPDLTVDLILLDIQIPHEDGYKILQQIRAKPELQATKVVALTANVMPEDVERARAAGFDGFIGKPIKSERFAGQIQRVLAGEEVWEAR